jgi:hypothetical protein
MGGFFALHTIKTVRGIIHPRVNDLHRDLPGDAASLSDM